MIQNFVWKHSLIVYLIWQGYLSDLGEQTGGIENSKVSLSNSAVYDAVYGAVYDAVYGAVYEGFSGTNASPLQLKNNIQLMIADYKDTCEEREQLLYSLADVSAISPKNGTIFHVYFFHVKCCASLSLFSSPFPLFLHSSSFSDFMYFFL